MRIPGAFIAILGVVTVPAASPVVLENHHIRLELDPRTFSVRFLGAPGGKNFLDVVYLPESAFTGGGWLEPGGIVTDVIPESENSPVLRQGPGDVVTRESNYLLLLGPPDETNHWRIKKEYFLSPGASELRYKVTVMSTLKEERGVGVRTTAQLRESGMLMIPAMAETLGLLRGELPDLQAMWEVDTSRYVVPIAGVGGRSGVVLGAPVAELAFKTPFGQWTRRLHVSSDVTGVEEDVKSIASILLDDTSHIYQAGLEFMQQGVNVGAPLVVEERWILAFPGENDAP